ncbi:hypothetical protein EH165_05990 [Nakamurella antarctica]|uniref:Uncharacterized protein n=1 Tax=Nakamurella antarctica TaxID=1902245 RepID=A0A3G8ZTG7_9ACTN|nr:hypothetical protein [Nakamurella antarctica]AZI57764.1 hypothetical protein EH165_05990 [Nakamurella antarctica]
MRDQDSASDLVAVLHELQQTEMTTEQRQRLLREVVPAVVAIVQESLRPEPGPQSELQQEVRHRTSADLVWVEWLRTALLTPTEEATSGARASAIRSGMAAGVPGSAYVAPTGLTLARIYQIRDGRR